MRRVIVGLLGALALACAGLPRWSGSADGRRVALWKDRSVFVVSRAGEVVGRFDVRAEISGAFLSPDGTAVVCQTERALTLFEVESELDREVASGKDCLVGDGWSPDGAHFAYVDAGGTLQLYERKSGRTRELHARARVNPCWARDSSALYTIERADVKGRGRLVRVALAGAVDRLADTAEWGWLQAAPDGSVYVAAPERGDDVEKDLPHARLRRWDPKTRTLTQISDEQIPWMQVSPDGKRLLAVTLRKGREKAEARSIVLLGADGVTERTLHTFDESNDLEVPPLWLDADTVLLAYERGAAEKVKLVDAATGRKTDWTAAYEALK